MSFTITPNGYLRTRGIGTPPAVILVGRSEFLTQLETDIDTVFFNQSEFGEMVEILHTGENTWQSYKTLFDNPYSAMNFGSEVEFNSVQPQIQLQESKLLKPIQTGDKIRFRGVRYQVETPISDGVGITTLFLTRLTS